ncbi:hypothetical protein D9611_009869 [Ephemerocybe angulata]|uniref:NACHT domain-containing protein n=1 Tax=Ephemerocybe angulata TaxID=980116 RepID=A0A8H5CE67_9AGAR|nr:hypothetical protein D9611_009869 [Tulosesus angulatus]
MDLGSNFSAKLEPFLLMAKSVKGAAAAKLIQDATSAPGVLVFSELLELPNIQELGKSEQHSKFLSLLQLFAYKTYQDYVQHKDALPPLNNAQITKLKYLSIVSLASERRILPYPLLLASLDMPNVRELEDLIIDAIYQDIIRGKLDQKEEQLEVEYTMGRDVEPGKVDELLEALRSWASTTAEVLTTLDAKITAIANEAATTKTLQGEYDRALQQTLKEVHDRQNNKGAGSSSGGNYTSVGSSSFVGSLAGGVERALGGSHRRERAERERDSEMGMDVDEPGEGRGGGKSRNYQRSVQPRLLLKLAAVLGLHDKGKFLFHLHLVSISATGSIMSNARLDADTLHRDTQEASSSNHPAAHGTHHHYNGPVNLTQYNVEHATNGVLGDNHGNIEQRGQNERKAIDEAEALRYLKQNIAPGAIHDSSERCDAPKCMKETRIAVQEDIMSWIDAGDQDAQPKKIMWVTGPAGTGKTAILGTIADTCKEKGTLAASFFFSAFSGSVDRRTKRCLVPTLAFQLMGHGDAGGIREHVLSSVARDQGMIFTKNLKEQLIGMVLNPLLSRAQEHGSCAKAARRVIIIDGLDECTIAQNDPARSTNAWGHLPIRRKEDDQREILSILLFAASNPSFPFPILVASRPEVSIRDFFATDGKACTQELFLDAKYDPDADIALFYDAKFSIICRRLGISPEQWPGKEAKLTLIRNASGQFIYATTVVRYIEGSPHSPNLQSQSSNKPSTPHERLQHILRQARAGSPHNPLEALDALYRLLLETSPDPELSMKWLRAAQKENNFLGHPFPVWLLRLVLEASPGEEQYALGPLSSLLSTQVSEENSLKPYSFYHKSFLDFIADPTRCGERFLTEEEALTWVVQRFFQTLDKHDESVTVVPYILSSDLQKWAAVWAERYQDLKGNKDLRKLLLMLDVLHRGTCNKKSHGRPQGERLGGSHLHPGA